MVLRFTEDAVRERILSVVVSTLRLTVELLSNWRVKVPPEVIAGREEKVALRELSKPRRVKVPGLVMDKVEAEPDLMMAILPRTLTAPPEVMVRGVPEVAPATMASFLYGELALLALLPDGSK